MRGPRTSGLPIQTQIPPTAATIGPDGRPTMQGPTSPVLPPGTVNQPTPLPVQRVPTQSIPPQQRSTLPIAPRGDTGLTPEGTPVAQVMNNRYPAPSGPAIAPVIKPTAVFSANDFSLDIEVNAPNSAPVPAPITVDAAALFKSGAD